MKTLFFIVIVASFVASCNTKSNNGTPTQLQISRSVIIDITDPELRPTADQVLQTYHCKNNPDAGFSFRLKAISDKRLNPIITYQLATAGSMEKENSDDDPQYRNKNIEAFYITVRKAVATFYRAADTVKSLHNSECFRNIADELHYLAEKNMGTRNLIVASDLMENSDLLNSYTADITNAKQVASQLNKESLLPDTLAGVTVIFLFNPKDRKQDLSFNRMAEAYKLLIQQRGGEVKVQANL
jgi:hypothetical protein